MSEQRILQRDAFDAMEFGALVFKGIGAGPVWDWDQPRDEALNLAPNCGHGLALAVEDRNMFSEETTVRDALLGIGVDFSESDRAVRSVNARKRRGDQHARISWKEYTRELNIVRGDS